MSDATGLSPERPVLSSDSFKQLSRPALFWIVGLCAFAPLSIAYFRWLWKFEHFQFFPFLLLAVAYLTWTRRVVPLQFPQRMLTKLLLAASIAVFLVSSLFFSPQYAAVGLVLFAGSFFITHRLFPLWILSLLVIRAPFGADRWLILQLQNVTTRLSSFVLDLLNVSHLVMGNTIELADRQLFVAEACSGVQSAYTITFVSLFIAIWNRRPLILYPCYVVLALIWAVLCNTLRVTSVAFAASQFNLDLSEGWAHDLTGYVALAIAILLVLSTDSLLAHWFHPVDHTDRFNDNPLVDLWNRLFWPSDERQRGGGVAASDAVASSDATTGDDDADDRSSDSAVAPRKRFLGKQSWAVYAMGGLVAFSLLSFAGNWVRGNSGVINADGQVLFDPSADVLNQMPGAVTFEYVGAVRGKADPTLGNNADQWRFRYGNLVGAFVYSQPYSDWHDFNRCYTQQEWRVVHRTAIQPGAGIEDNTPVAVTRLVRNDLIGYLVFTGLESDGSSIDPPFFEPLTRFYRRCAGVFTGKRYGGTLTGDCTMMQMWVVTNEPLDDRAIGDLVDAVAHARNRLSGELVAAIGN